MRSTSLSQLAFQIRQRADLTGQDLAFGQNTVGNANVTDGELCAMIQGSTSKIWDLLIYKFGDNYTWSSYTWSPTQGVFTYNLPFDYYKEDSVKMCVDGSGINFIRVLPYTSRESGDFSWPLNTQIGLAGFGNIRWQVQGNVINFLPNAGPLPGFLRLEYFSACPVIVSGQLLPGIPNVPTAYPALAPIITGQLVSASVTVGTLTTSQVFAALNSGTSGASAPVWVVPGTVTDSGGITWAYQGPASLFQTTFDGISAYEELIILDSAIKCRTKQEKDVMALSQQFAAEMERITLASANRQAGDPMVIKGGWGLSDSVNGFQGTGFNPFTGW